MAARNFILSSIGFLAAASALPTASSPNDLHTREWQECAPGTWYSKCGAIDGCFDYDPCIAPPTAVKPRDWQECALGTWYSKCGIYDGCFDYDPCIAPPVSVKPREWQECAPGTWYSKCGAIDGCFNYDPCVAPPTTSTTEDLEAREWKECAAGTWYSKCGIYDGCFNYDPCISPSTSSSLETREYQDCAAGTWYYKCGENDGCFDHDPCSSTTPAGPSCTNGTTTDDQRDMFVVVPANPETTGSAVKYFQVVSGSMDINQVGVFSGIPAEAKSCSLGWKQGDAASRSFKVTGNGRVSVFQIEGIDATDGVSWSEVEGATVTSTEFGPDLTNWDSPSIGATDHGSWGLTCAETIYLKFATHKGPEDTGSDEYRNVYLEQDDNNGFYVSYTC